MNTGDILPSVDGPRCVTCGAALLGDYCHACGEKRVTPDDLTVRHYGETTIRALIKAVTILAFAYVLDSLVTVVIVLITLAMV